MQVIAEPHHPGQGRQDTGGHHEAPWPLLRPGLRRVHPFYRPHCKILGFDENHANILEIANGRLTGTVREPILGRQAKVDALDAIARQRNLPHDFIAVGDGANDLPMLKLAGMGVALHAKPSVAAAAKYRIDHGDLTALLYLQGYRQREFAGAV